MYGAIVLAAAALDIQRPLLDGLALLFIVARLLQSLVHLAFPEAPAAVAPHFGFFLIQVGCMLAMIVAIMTA